MQIIYLIYILFNEPLLYVLVCYKPGSTSYYLLKTICFLQGCYIGYAIEYKIANLQNGIFYTA